MFAAGGGTWSRTSSEQAPVEICPRCGLRETLYGRDSSAQPAQAEWPLPPEQLAQEERLLIAAFQAGEMTPPAIPPAP